MNYDESCLQPYVLFFKARVNSHSVERISESLIRNPKGGGEYGEGTSKGPQKKTQVGPLTRENLFEYYLSKMSYTEACVSYSFDSLINSVETYDYYILSDEHKLKIFTFKRYAMYSTNTVLLSHIYSKSELKILYGDLICNKPYLEFRKSITKTKIKY